MIRQILVLGGHIQALGVVRQAKKEGIRTVLILTDGWSVARYSRYVDEVRIVHKDKLIEILEEYKDTDSLLFPTSDEFVEILSRNRDFFQTHFVLGIPTCECVDLFNDKKRAYTFCAENNIPHPYCYYPSNLDDVIRISSNINYPVVVKPSTMYTFHSKFGKKAYLCHSKDELFDRCKFISDSDYPISGLLIQEFLSGGAKTLYSFGVFSVNGVPKAWIQANRIRQNPMTFGNSTTFAISCHHHEVEELARSIIKQVNYSGIAEIEFMFDIKTGKYKFLEINTRAWKWHTLSEAFGFGFISEMIRFYNGKESKFSEKHPTKAWVERLTDYSVICKELIAGRLSFNDVLSSYRISKVNAVWTIVDPLPAFAYLVMSPVLYFKRH